MTSSDATIMMHAHPITPSACVHPKRSEQPRGRCHDASQGNGVHCAMGSIVDPTMWLGGGMSPSNRTDTALDSVPWHSFSSPSASHHVLQLVPCGAGYGQGAEPPDSSGPGQGNQQVSDRQRPGNKRYEHGDRIRPACSRGLRSHIGRCDPPHAGRTVADSVCPGLGFSVRVRVED